MAALPQHFFNNTSKRIPGSLFNLENRVHLLQTEKWQSRWNLVFYKYIAFIILANYFIEAPTTIHKIFEANSSFHVK